MTADRLFSLEFFPPRTPEGIEKLRATRRQLAQLKPAFCSVTFGAGGSTRDGTLATVLEFHAEGMDGVPHISCMGGSRQALGAVLASYQAHGIRHVVALRGDLPSGIIDAGDFTYASELVAFIRQQTGDWFHIEVAAYPEYHPQAKSPQADLAAFKRKIDAGANSAITQYFYNADAYWHFVDSCAAAGISVPIVPGHADQQFRQARALFRRLRCRISTLDPQQAPSLWRRYRVGSRFRVRRGHGSR